MSKDRCPQCGAEGTAGGPCPSCLMQLGMPDTTIKGGGAATPSPHRPSRIGPYKIVADLGEGGMGVVYLAEQETPVRRQVALKIIKHGMDTKQGVARFESERQALALMDHPAIATVFDAGNTLDGRMYFAMEYVSGVPITEHCDRKRLTNRERLELFRQVCDGVQHAHHKAIIHRDLKPSNILVSSVDGKPIPKIIDFGVAKSVAQRLTEKTLHTDLGVLVGTPAYMSPEQAEVSRQDVDTRTDVYALGVILYELLIGVLPFDPKELREAGFESMLRTIREVDPPRPSARFSGPGHRSEETAQLRNTDPPVLRRELVGDLDWIVMRALEKDPGRRYGSPAELSADLGRYLHDEPVAARPPDLSYRVRKFARRNKALTASMAAIASILVLATIVSTFFATSEARHRREAERARMLAKSEAEVATRVSDFLVEIFQYADPEADPTQEVTARQLLESGAARLDDLEGQPEVQARLQKTIGTVYQDMGLFEEAIGLLERSLETRREIHTGDHADLAVAINDLAIVYTDVGRYEESEKLLAETAAMQRRLFGEGSSSVGEVDINQGMVLMLMGDYDAAEPLFQEAVQIFSDTTGEDRWALAVALGALGSVYYYREDYEAAKAPFDQALEICEEMYGTDHPRLVSMLNNVANLALDRGELERSEAMFLRAVDISEKSLGTDHPELAPVLHNLGRVKLARGQPEEAEVAIKRAIEIDQAARGPEHQTVARSLLTMAEVQLALERPAEADLSYRRAISIYESLGSNHERLASALDRYATFLDEQGRGDQAGEARAHAERTRAAQPD